MKFDQHFLINEEVLKKVLKVAGLKKSDTIFEIGPGKGVLTLELAKYVKKVIAIEIDTSQKIENLPKNVEFIYGNALNKLSHYKFNKIISNIPYSISEPLLKKLTKLDFDQAVLMVGETFYKILLDEKTKLSQIAEIFFKIEKIAEVSKDSFNPPPKTKSVILRIKKRGSNLNKKDKIIKEFILQDDKKVKNALIYSFIRVNGLTKKQAREKIYELNLPPKIYEKNVDYLSNRQFGLILKVL
jgi:16S rRNA (adenine1518-N6/adenine1519-N6)-dimethyltransferase